MTAHRLRGAQLAGGHRLDGGTPFGDRLDEQRALAGAAKLSIEVLSACSHLERGSAISPKQRDRYLAALEARMAQLVFISVTDGSASSDCYVIPASLMNPDD